MTKTTYYGIFFWLSLITFVVPFFVAYRAFDKLQPTIKPTPDPDASGVDHKLWDYLLKTYVANGLIDYQGFRRDYLFKVYLQQLGAANLEALETKEERLALYINAYNAFVIQAVILHQIQSSVKEFEHNGLGFFNQPEHLFANKTYSLNELEHGIIRPGFGEPRIHMALVCAAKSCPVIRTEAYVGSRLEEQLEDQFGLFSNNPQHVAYDREKDTVLVNAILDWYGYDFDPQGGYLKLIAERCEDPKLKAKLQLADQGKIETGFIDYDWSLNSQGPNRAYSGGRAEAGSGTIPNE